MQTIDKTKKSNIKCEHCKYWSGYGNVDKSICDKYPETPIYNLAVCNITQEAKDYWNRCKSFEWKEGN